jgi:prefoldin alpha subunit
MDSEHLQEQVSNYEHFVKKVLQPKLSVAESEANTVRAEITNYGELATSMKDRIASGETGESIKSMVDLGHRTVFCNAVVNNPKKIFVKVGLGFHVELTPEEASKFAKKRISFLNTYKLEEKESEIKDIKGHIQSASIILDQLHAEMERS